MTPIYTTVLANPDPVQWTASSDGRYIGIGAPTERLDVDTLASIPTSAQGILSGDAESVVGFTSPTELVRVDVVSGAVEPLPPMPFGWAFNFLDGTSSDGRAVVVDSLSASQESGMFVLDAGAAVWREIGFVVAGDPCPFVNCEDALISDSGTTVVFDVSDNVNPEQSWAVTASGPTLVSVTAGGGPGNGDSQVEDVTPDGRYVLFSSYATDLQGGTGDPSGRLYIRDLQAATTTLLPLLITDGQPSLSADAQRVAYPAPATLASSGGAVLTTVAAVFDRTTGKVTKLLPTDTAADVAWLGPIQISDNGRRVMWNRGDPNLGQLVLERVDFIGG